MTEILVCSILLGVIFIFVRLSMRIRSSGGSLSTLVSGSTDAFLNYEKKNAAAVIAEIKSGKYIDEQSSGEPENLQSPEK